MKKFMATTVTICTHWTWWEIHVLLFFRVEFGIFLSYKFRAFKIFLVKFPNLVIFFFTGQNPWWPMATILEKKTKMDKLMVDTTFSWFLGSVNMILTLFQWFEGKFISCMYSNNDFGVKIKCLTFDILGDPHF